MREGEDITKFDFQFFHISSVLEIFYHGHYGGGGGEGGGDLTANVR